MNSTVESIRYLYRFLGERVPIYCINHFKLATKRLITTSLFQLMTITNSSLKISWHNQFYSLTGSVRLFQCLTNRKGFTTKFALNLPIYDALSVNQNPKISHHLLLKNGIICQLKMSYYSCESSLVINRL